MTSKKMLHDSMKIGNLIPVLKQSVRLIEEPNGAVLVSDPDDTRGRYVLISSIEAFIVSLFDGHRTISEISALLAAFQHSPSPATIDNDVHKIACSYNEFIEELNEPADDRRINVDPRVFLRKEDMSAKPVRPEKPLWVDFYVTRNCNLRCAYCFANAKYVDKEIINDDTQVRFARLCTIIDQIVDLGIQRILITGGEPTLFPYLADVIRRITGHGIKVMLASNGCLFTDELAETLRAAGLQRVQAKLDAGNAGIQDKLSGVNGTFSNLTRGIKILKNHGFHVSVVMVVTAWNIGEVMSVAQICADLGVDELSLRVYTAGIWALQGRGSAYLNLSPAAIMQLAEQVADLRLKYDDIMKIEPLDTSLFTKKTPDKVPFCPGFISSCCILDNGLVVPCEMLADFSDEFLIGDTKKQSILEIWNSQQAMDWVLRKSPQPEGPCIACDEFRRCKGGCAWKAYVAYDKKWLCDPSCIKAPRPSRIPFPIIE